MNELFENEIFFLFIATGIMMYQQKVLDAHRRKEPLKIDGNFYYVQSGQERLQEMIDRICE